MELNCPACGKAIDVEVEYWDTETVCPLCKTELVVEYDEYYSYETEEEYGYWTLKIAEDE